MAAVTICSDFGAQENKSLTISIVPPSICHEVMGPDAMNFVFWMLSFKPAFTLPFSLVSRRSLLSAIRVMSSAYLRLLIFLPAILIPAVSVPVLQVRGGIWGKRPLQQNSSEPAIWAYIKPQVECPCFDWPWHMTEGFKKHRLQTSLAVQWWRLHSL